MNAVLSYVRNGGVFMYPILLGAMWALTLLVERTIFFVQCQWRMNRQANTFFALLANRDLPGAQRYLQSQRGLVRDVLMAGVKNRDKPSARVEEKMESVLLRELPVYAKHLNVIASLAGLMPLLGLLGTVSGMIATFKVIALQGTGDVQAMAGGISVALITTQAGLVAALPIILGHVFLSNRLKRITDRTKEICVLFIDYVKDSHDNESN